MSTMHPANWQVRRKIKIVNGRKNTRCDQTNTTSHPRASTRTHTNTKHQYNGPFEHFHPRPHRLRLHSNVDHAPSKLAVPTKNKKMSMAEKTRAVIKPTRPHTLAHPLEHIRTQHSNTTNLFFNIFIRRRTGCGGTLQHVAMSTTYLRSIVANLDEHVYRVHTTLCTRVNVHTYHIHCVCCR